uniref:Transmembrane protein n=1 Tax=Medicago truncatula TaxID=3880 RepID=I3SA85_MEDTR|nr:unknown [Medicago truncatula]
MCILIAGTPVILFTNVLITALESSLKPNSLNLKFHKLAAAVTMSKPSQMSCLLMRGCMMMDQSLMKILIVNLISLLQRTTRMALSQNSLPDRKSGWS